MATTGVVVLYSRRGVWEIPPTNQGEVGSLEVVFHLLVLAVLSPKSVAGGFTSHAGPTS